MDDVQDYRRRARECRELAKTAAPQHRAIVEAIAEQWAKLADDREKMLLEAPGTKKQEH